MFSLSQLDCIFTLFIQTLALRCTMTGFLQFERSLFVVSRERWHAVTA